MYLLWITAGILLSGYHFPMDFLSLSYVFAGILLGYCWAAMDFSCDFPWINDGPLIFIRNYWWAANIYQRLLMITGGFMMEPLNKIQNKMKNKMWMALGILSGN